VRVFTSHADREKKNSKPQATYTSLVVLLAICTKAIENSANRA
jgi:hypothetical protein